jgi:ribonuclease BN (tRNA processing enzyme)
VDIVVLGCGEAFDESLPNTSLLVRTASAKILLDCGYSVPQQVWRTESDPNAIDLVYISHAHADHLFGLPALLGRMWEDGRTKPLVVMSQPEVLEKAAYVMELGYPTLRARFQYPIEFRAVSPADHVEFESITFRFAETHHSVSNLAVRLDFDGHSMCYSGDGDRTPASCALFEGSDLVFHEAFGFERSPVHGEITDVLAMGRRHNVKKLALMHVRRNVRRERTRLFEAMLAAEVRCVLPSPGDALFV